MAIRFVMPDRWRGDAVWWARPLGLSGLYLFAFSALLSVAAAYLGLLAMCIGMALRARDWNRLWRDPVVAMGLVFACFVLAQSWYALPTARALGAEEALWEAAGDWLKLLLFLPFAYWSGGEPDRLARLLGLWLAGFAVGILLHVDWTQLDGGVLSRRFESYLPAIAFGMFTGLGALGLIALRRRCWGVYRVREPRGVTGRGVLRSILWIALSAFMAQGLVQSYSRGSWLAFVAGLAVLAWSELRPAPAGPVPRDRRAAWPFLAVLGLIALVLVGNGPRLYQRALDEVDVVERALREGEVAGGQPTSVGLRLHVWRFGLDAWEERPWFGWGAGLTRASIADAERPELIMHDGTWMVHLHNSYLELLLQFGLVGAALFGAWLWLLGRDAARSCRSGRMPRDLCRFWWATVVFVLVWCLFNYRLVHHDWRFFWILAVGAMYGARVRALVAPFR